MQLNKTFITPFDREDIFALSRAVETTVVDHRLQHGERNGGVRN